MLLRLALGFSILALSGLVLYGIAGLSGGSGYARVGPEAFPRLVAGGLFLIGLGLLIVRPVRSFPEIDFFSLLTAIVGMIAVISLLEIAGFPIAAAFLVAFTARAFGSRRFFLDLAIGFALGIVCLIVFNLGLGVSLPRGPFDALF